MKVFSFQAFKENADNPVNIDLLVSFAQSMHCRLLLALEFCNISVCTYLVVAVSIFSSSHIFGHELLALGSLQWRPVG